MTATITDQIITTKKPKKPTGVTPMTPITIITQPSHLGSAAVQQDRQADRNREDHEPRLERPEEVIAEDVDRFGRGGADAVPSFAQSPFQAGEDRPAGPEQDRPAEGDRGEPLTALLATQEAAQGAGEEDEEDDREGAAEVADHDGGMVEPEMGDDLRPGVVLIRCAGGEEKGDDEQNREDDPGQGREAVKRIRHFQSSC